MDPFEKLWAAFDEFWKEFRELPSPPSGTGEETTTTTVERSRFGVTKTTTVKTVRWKL